MDSAFAIGMTYVPGGEGGGDETKYDKRHAHREGWALLQKVGGAALVVVALFLLLGDSILLEYKASERGQKIITAKSVVNAHGPGIVGGSTGGVGGAGDGGAVGDGELPVPRPPPIIAGGGDGSGNGGVNAWTNDEGGGRGGGGGGGGGGGEKGGGRPPRGGGEARAPPPLPLLPQPPVQKQQSLRGVGAKVVDWITVQSPDGCDGYFGNGYDLSFSLVGADGSVKDGRAARAPMQRRGRPPGDLAWCRVHTATYAIVCGLRNLRLDASLISMSVGGEALNSVMGRAEDAEVPRVHAGAFYLLKQLPPRPAVASVAEGLPDGLSPGPRLDATLPPELAREGRQRDPYKIGMLGEVAVVDASAANPCATLVTEPVIFVSRMEYANLFHTSTDWYNVWQTARLVGLDPTSEYDPAALRGLTPAAEAAEAAAPRTITRRIPAHIVFYDGHNASPMDPGWLAAFLSINYAKHFEPGTCFAETYHAPFGYHAAISQGMAPRGDTCHGNAVVRQFGDDFVRAFGLSPRGRAACDVVRNLVVALLTR